MSARPRRPDASVQMAATLRLFQSTGQDWPKDDLPDLLEAQLSLPAPTTGALTWRTTLLSPPALDDIVALKETAKAWVEGGSAMPGEIARLLYIAAIASATRSFGTKISRLPAHQLDWHRAWALSQNWADRNLLELIRQWKIEPGD